jgi:hypothetical protein
MKDKEANSIISPHHRAAWLQGKNNRQSIKYIFLRTLCCCYNAHSVKIIKEELAFQRVAAGKY